MADSRSFVGGIPLCRIVSSWVSRQLLLKAIRVEHEKSSRYGSRNGFGTPAWVRDGPIPRIRTCFGVVPEMMNPPMPTLSPVWTRILVERLRACAGVEGGVEE